MEETGLRPRTIFYAHVACKYYIRIASFVWVLFSIAVLYLSFHGDNLREYCIHVPADEYHHIKVSENNACLIDWWYFIHEPIFMLVLVFIVAIVPFMFLNYGFKKAYETGSTHGS